MLPDALQKATAAHPAALRAQQFQRSFAPKDGVDYAWVEQYAKEQYQSLQKTFNDLDAKATAIINYMTSGTGLFTLGTLVAAAGAKLSPWIVGAALPSILSAIAAIVFAALARRPMTIFPPPPPEQMADMAERFMEPGRGRAYMIPVWQWCDALLRHPIDVKARYLDLSTWCMIATVSLLLLPLLVGLCIGWSAVPAA